MRFPRRLIGFLVSLALFAILFPASGAQARIANPVIEPVSPSIPQRVYPNGFVSGSNVCTTGPFQLSYPSRTSYLAPPEMIATLLKTTDCATCSGNLDTLRAVAAHIYADFSVACGLPIKVSIVGATDSAGCMLPDTNVVLCPAVTTTLSAVTPGFKDEVIALPAGCEWTGPAFLLVAFLSPSAPCDTASRFPRLHLTGSCTTCHGFDYFLDARIEMCSIDELNGRVAMWVDVASCAVPVTRRSWGQLKTLNRP